MRSSLRLALLALALAFAGSCAAPPTEPPVLHTTDIGVTPALADLAYEWLAGFAPQDPTHDLALRVLPLAAGLEAARSGEIEFLISSAPPQPGWFATPLADGALLVVVPASTNIRSLTLRELRAIYNGQLSSWEELGAGSRSIQALLYPAGDELRTQFESLAMGGTRISANTLLVPDPASMAREVAAGRGALGILPDWSLAGDLRALSIEGTAPTAANLVSGSYPLSLQVTAQAPAEPDSLARDWLGWIQSLAATN